MTNFQQTMTKVATDFLIGICNVLVTAGIKNEERAYIMGHKSMILHIMAELESSFGKSY